MKKYSSINSKTLGKLLKRYKLTTRGKKKISKAAQKATDAKSANDKLIGLGLTQAEVTAITGYKPPEE